MSALEVNGVRILANAIRAESARLRQEALSAGEEVSLDDAVRFLQEAEELLIERALLDQEAARLAIQVAPEEVDSALARFVPPSTSACRTDPHTTEVRADIERRLKIDKLVEVWTRDLKRPGAKMLRDVYKREKGQFQVSERISLSQIVKNVHHADEREPARAALERVAKELKSGASFSALAAAHSDCPEEGGALGFITRGAMVPEFEDVVFSLPLQVPSPVFETRFGFHIAMVAECRAAGLLDFSEAAPQIENALMMQAKERALGARLRELRSQASVRRVSA